MDKGKGGRMKPEIYMSLNLHELILISIYLVIANGETCTFERLVAECFENFPKAFSFKRYPKWPDALKFDRPLRALRGKGLIMGNPRDAFVINEYGERKAKELMRASRAVSLAEIHKATRPSSGRSADDRIIEFIRLSPAYLRFLRSPRRFQIAEQEFRNLLRCTLETPSRVVKQNLEYYLKVAKEYGEKEIEKFLLSCKREFVKGGNFGKRTAY